MPSQFNVFDVSAEFLMDVANLVSTSPHKLSKEDIINSFDKNPNYINLAISQCILLGLIEIQGGFYIGSLKIASLIKSSERSQHKIQFRSVLQKYPLFLLFITFISKGYNIIESAKMVKGIFRLTVSEKIIEKSLKNWGIYADLIILDKNVIKIPEAEAALPTEYVKNLLKALKAELQANLFLIDTMGPSVYSYLIEKKINIDDLSYALINYENEPKLSANKSSQMLEFFLYKLAEDKKIDVKSYNGPIQLGNALRANKSILSNHSNLITGFGTIRNMAHHDPDKETGKPWEFTPQGAIITTLAVPTLMRSLYIYSTEMKQEF